MMTQAFTKQEELHLADKKTEAAASIRHRYPKAAPTTSPAPPEKPVCKLFRRCDGCPYPAHGFICWGQDGRCMRTITNQISEKDKEGADV